MSTADASATAPVTQTLGALVHTATDTPSAAPAVGAPAAQTIPIGAVAPTQPPPAGAGPPSPPAGAAPLQTAVHGATQVAGAVHTTGERVAALAAGTAQGASHANPATIVRTVAERAPVAALADGVQRAAPLPQGGLAQTARGVTRVLAGAADAADAGHAVRTLAGGSVGSTLTRTLTTLADGGSTVTRTLTTLPHGDSTVTRTLSALAPRSGAVQRSAALPAHPAPGTAAPAAHDGARPASAPLAVDRGAPEAQREVLAAQTQAGIDRGRLQSTRTTSTWNVRAWARAPLGVAMPWRDTEPLHDGQSSAPSPAHGAPPGTPLSVAPPSPGGVSPATAVGSGAGLALGLGLLALLVVLGAPPAVRRLRLDNESWRRAPLMLIADRPG